MTRALLAQINYIVDVAANMPANTHTTASGVFRLAWRGRQKSTTIVVRLRTVNTGEATLSATDFWTGFWTLFWGPIQGLVFHRSAYKPASFQQHIETQAGFVTLEIHLPNLR